MEQDKHSSDAEGNKSAQSDGHFTVLIGSVLRNILNELPEKEHLEYSQRLLPLPSEEKLEAVAVEFFHWLLSDEGQGLVSFVSCETVRQAIFHVDEHWCAGFLPADSPESDSLDKSYVAEAEAMLKSSSSYAVEIGRWLSELGRLDELPKLDPDSQGQEKMLPLIAALVNIEVHKLEVAGMAASWKAEEQSLKSAVYLASMMSSVRRNKSDEETYYASKSVQSARSAAAYTELSDLLKSRAARLSGASVEDAPRILSEAMETDLDNFSKAAARWQAEELCDLLQAAVSQTG